MTPRGPLPLPVLGSAFLRDLGGLGSRDTHFRSGVLVVVNLLKSEEFNYRNSY